MSKVYIPKVKQDEIKARAERIKPVVSFSGKPYYIKEVDLFNIAYTWEPKQDVPAEGLKVVKTITTYHGYGYYGFFKPSIAEVLAQIPAELLDKVVAFEIVNSPSTVEDLNKHKVELDAGYHVAETALYVKE